MDRHTRQERLLQGRCGHQLPATGEEQVHHHNDRHGELELQEVSLPHRIPKQEEVQHIQGERHKGQTYHSF